MRNKLIWVGVLVVLCAPRAAMAQTVETTLTRTLLLPGSLNLSAGTLAPAEPDNLLTSVTTEQGFTAFRRNRLFVVGFMNVTARYDTDNLPWNRTMPATAGVKIVTLTRAGMFQGVIGVNALERTDAVRVSKAVYGTYWTSWRGDAVSSHRLISKALPGHAYASTGFVTAAEPENWISSVYVQQGATLIRHWGVSAIPFVGAGGTADTAGAPWNNRTRLDAGVKATRELLTGVLEAGIAQRREWDYRAGDRRVAPVIFVNYWLGWNPAVGRSR